MPGGITSALPAALVATSRSASSRDATVRTRTFASFARRSVICLHEVAAVLVGDRQVVGRLAGPVAAVEAREREARDADHDDRRKRDERERDAVAEQQAQILRNDHPERHGG